MLSRFPRIDDRGPVGTWRNRAGFWEVNKSCVSLGDSGDLGTWNMGNGEWGMGKGEGRKGGRIPDTPPGPLAQVAPCTLHLGLLGSMSQTKAGVVVWRTGFLGRQVLAKRQRLIRLGPGAEKNKIPLIGQTPKFWGRKLTLHLPQPGMPVPKSVFCVNANPGDLYRIETSVVQLVDFTLLLIARLAHCPQWQMLLWLSHLANPRLTERGVLFLVPKIISNSIHPDVCSSFPYQCHISGIHIHVHAFTAITHTGTSRHQHTSCVSAFVSPRQTW